MNTRFTVDARLKELGIAVEPWKVKRVISHLRDGGSMHALYTAKPPIVAQKTILKIKKALDSGELLFLQTIIDFEEMDLQEERIKAVQKAEEMCPHSEFTFDKLTGYGLVPELALELMIKYDTFHEERKSALREILRPVEDEGEDEGEVYEEVVGYTSDEFIHMEQYLALLYQVAFSRDYPNAPFMYAELAGKFLATAKMSNDEALEAAAIGIMRYAIWNEGNFNYWMHSLANFNAREGYFADVTKALNNIREQMEQADRDKDKTPLMIAYEKRRMENAVTRRYGRNMEVKDNG